MLVQSKSNISQMFLLSRTEIISDNSLDSSVFYKINWRIDLELIELCKLDKKEEFIIIKDSINAFDAVNFDKINDWKKNINLSYNNKETRYKWNLIFYILG